MLCGRPDGRTGPAGARAVVPRDTTGVAAAAVVDAAAVRRELSGRRRRRRRRAAAAAGRVASIRSGRWARRSPVRRPCNGANSTINYCIAAL